MLEHLFLSVGAMKAGTTWLYEQLKNHPDIHFTPEKEIHYFANRVGIENQLSHRNRILKLKRVMERHARGNPSYIAEHLEEIAWYANYALPREISNPWYESLFQRNPGRKFCADFSNLYCQMESDGWTNVRSICSNLKIIYTLRDPLDRIWSHYKFHMKWLGREDEAVTAGFENFKDILEKPYFWVNVNYAQNYSRLKQNLEEHELMILYFEDFRASPRELLDRVQDFLGVRIIDPLPDELEEKVNKSKSFELPAQWRDYVMKKLEPLFQEMNEAGTWHPRWTIT